MEFARQFFDGLDGPASLTFLGILVLAFLIGIVPMGLAYVLKLRDLRRRIAAHARAHQTTAQERSLLAGQLERQHTELDDATSRLRRQSTERARQEQALQESRTQADRLRADLLRAQAEVVEQGRQLEAVRNKLSTVSAQLQSVRQSERPRPMMAPPAGAFDIDTLSSLRAARTRAEGLEARLQQVTADNEALRLQLAR